MNEEELINKIWKANSNKIRLLLTKNTIQKEEYLSDLIRYGIKQGFQKGKLEAIRVIDENIKEAKDCTAHTCRFDFFDREEDICLPCFEAQVLKELKEQLQKEIGRQIFRK